MTNTKSDITERLIHFRSKYSSKHISINGKIFPYHSAGKGDVSILLLTGGIGAGEVYFLHLMELEKYGKVIVPTYPVVKNLEELICGIIAILEQEDVRFFYLIGQSFGGMLGQLLMRKFPDRIPKAVLVHTLTVFDEHPGDMSIWGMQMLDITAKHLPDFILRGLNKSSIRMLTNSMVESERDFWKGFFDEVLDSRTYDEILTMYKLISEFTSRYGYGEDSFREWPGDLLIMDSEGDPLIPKKGRQKTRSLHPRAEVVSYDDYGHLAILDKRDEYLSRIITFFGL